MVDVDDRRDLTAQINASVTCQRVHIRYKPIRIGSILEINYRGPSLKYSLPQKLKHGAQFEIENPFSVV